MDSNGGDERGLQAMLRERLRREVWQGRKEGEVVG
jgi:hypothetical protein